MLASLLTRTKMVFVASLVGVGMAGAQAPAPIEYQTSVPPGNGATMRPGPTTAQPTGSTQAVNMEEMETPPAPQTWSTDSAAHGTPWKKEAAPRQIIVMADFLYLKPRRPGGDFAILDNNNDGIASGSIQNVSPERNPGVRVHLDYFSEPDSIDLRMAYTYFHSSDQRTVNAPAGGILYATMAHPRGLEEVTTARASANVDYDVLDFELGRRFDVGLNSQVRVFGGLRSAWIDQNLSVFYNGQDADRAQVRNPVYFDGFGGRLGGEGRVALFGALSAFARADASLLAGQQRIRHSETNNNGALVLANVSDRNEGFFPVFEMAMGLSWNWGNFRLNAGYQFINWFNLADTISFTDDVHAGKYVHQRGDLSLGGFFLQSEFAF